MGVKILAVLLVLALIAIVVLFIDGMIVRHELRTAKADLIRTQAQLAESMALTDRNLETLKVYERIMEARNGR